MKKLIIKVSDERLIIPSGIYLVGSMLVKSDCAKKYNKMYS